MTTNQIMVRHLDQYEVSQRTSDGMFNATALLQQWNESNGQQKQMIHYFENNATQEFISALIVEENLNGDNAPYLKSRGRYNGGTWMHPLLFIDFAMWLNPVFKVKVLKFVYDQLLEFRNDAGDTYKEMCVQVASLVEKPFMAKAISFVAKANNHIVYGDHTPMARNSGTVDETKELVDLQKRVTNVIADGFITTYTELQDYLRDLWRKKNRPKF